MSTNLMPFPGIAKMEKRGNIFWSSILTILGILCFPANPLVLAGIIEVKTYMPLVITGSFVWTFGMLLVLTPIILFPRRGGVSKGKSYMHTTRLVDSGIYAVVRHPQYTGGIYAIFLATMLIYPHWLFFILGTAGIAVIYMSCKEEDRRLVKKFGDDYKLYMQRVPGMNIFAGIARLNKKSKQK